MEKSGEKNFGCGKIIVLISAAVLIILVIGGGLEGISNIFNNIPWYVNIFLSIGFIYLMLKFFDN